MGVNGEHSKAAHRRADRPMSLLYSTGRLRAKELPTPPRLPGRVARAMFLAASVGVCGLLRVLVCVCEVGGEQRDNRCCGLAAVMHRAHDEICAAHIVAACEYARIGGLQRQVAGATDLETTTREGDTGVRAPVGWTRSETERDDDDIGA